jgi:ATP synthase I subunit
MNLDADSQTESFYSDAVRRIPRFMIVLAVALSGVGWIRLGWRVALGFACGCAVAYLNFHWLERVVNALGERSMQTAYRQSSGGIVFRFLVRYFLMAAAAYAIFSVSPASVYGLFAGLFLPVAGIACEAGYELYVAVSRGL